MTLARVPVRLGRARASLIGIPSAAAHPHDSLFPQWARRYGEKALEELGGVLYFRVHCRRVHRPGHHEEAVEVAVEVLSRTLPNTLWEVEVATDATCRSATRA